MLAAWPLILVALDPDWIFSPVGSIDPWVYFGTFVNLSHNLINFAGTYYVGRLSWIIPGYLAHAILPPVAANICLHLAVFYTAVFACYTCLRLTAGARSALVVSLVLCTYPPFLDAVGWDYVDGPGIAYFLAALATATAFARSTRLSAWGVVSGGLAACCVITNLAWLALLPGYVAYVILMLPGLSAGASVVRGAVLAAGALLVTAGCAIVNARITGDYWFFLPSIDAARSLTSQPNPWQSPTYDWVWASVLLGMALALVLMSLTRLWVLLRKGGTRHSVALHLVWLWSALVMLAIQLSGTPVLQITYYASYLIPGVAMAAGELLARPLARVPARFLYWMVGAAAAGASLAFVYPQVGALGGPFGLFHAAGLTLATGMTLYLGSTRHSYVAVAILSIFLLSAKHPRIISSDSERLRNYRITNAALEHLRPIQWAKPLYFWYSDEQAPALTGAYTSISSCYLWGYRLFSTKYPLRTTLAGTTNEASPGQRIVLMSHDRPTVDDLEFRLNAPIEIVHEAQIAHEGIAFNMLVFDVR